MSNLLAGIFSKADSLKRALNDAFSEPLAYAEQAIGYGVDRLKQNTVDMNEANSGSVLVSKDQKDAANKRVTDRMVDQVGGAGMIVPAKALNRQLAGIAEQLIGQGKSKEAYATTKMFLDPVDNMLKAVIPDTDRVFSPTLYADARKANKRIPSVMSTDDLPTDLRKLLDQTTLVPQTEKGAYYSALADKIGMGPDNQKELKSTLLHEVQHASQYMYDMQRGGNPDFFFSDFGKFDTARRLVEGKIDDLFARNSTIELTAPGKVAGPSELRYTEREKLLSDPDYLSSLASFLHAPRVKAHELYKGIPGEAEARLVQRQFETGDYTTLPYMLSDVAPGKMTLDPKNVPKVDADPVTQAILNKILGYGE